MKKPRILPQVKPIKILLGLIVSFVLILSYIVACSDNDPVDDQLILPDPIADENLIIVGTDGGVFVLPSGIEVTIPQGAVTEEKEIKVEVLDLTAVNALSAINISENTSFLSGISIATDIFDFKKPINIKIPLQSIEMKSLAMLYELNNESDNWLFSDETIIVNRQDNFIEIILKVSDEKSKQKFAKDLNSFRSFFIKLFGDIFLSEDSCKYLINEIRNLALDNATGAGCDATRIHEEITFSFCDPPQTGAFIAQEISSKCKPQLDITPEGKLKIKKDDTQKIQLTTSVAGFELSQQEIKVIAADDNLLVTTPILITDPAGNASFDVKGMKVGEGRINLSVTFKYALTTIIASSNELIEESPYDVVTSNLDTIIDIEVVGELNVTTDAVSNIESRTATVGGNVTDDGGETVTDRGVYWGESENPKETGSKLQLGSGLGDFIGNLADLEPNTTYYVMAYATNKDKTADGEIVSFKTLDEKCEVTTTLDTNYECDTATVGGNVTCEGDAIATERGIYLDGVKMQSGSGTGSFSVDLTDLEENTSYTVQAYVTSDADIELGQQITFTTPECELIDIDGNVYKTVKIGTQVWMAENLKTTTYNDGSSIVLETDPWEWQRGEPKYSWYNNDISNKDVYGALYNWFAVYTGKLCPLGWHVSSSEEYQTLMEYVGGPDIAAGKLKETGTSHWFPPNTGATDEYGFTALPGGYRKGFHVLTYEDGDEDFRGLGEHGVWWTSTAYGSRRISGYAFGMSYDYEDSEMGPSNSGGWGYCVRCVKD